MPLSAKPKPLMRSAPLKSKPTIERTIRKKKCKACRELFTPRSSWAKTCSPDCAEVFIEAEKARKARKERQEGLAKLKTRSDWIKEVQRNFNAYIRARDRDKTCICCGKLPKAAHLTGGAWDAGHYRSVGSAPHLRFSEDNCHRQTKHCNRDGAGRAVDYRIGLIARIGLERVEALEADNHPRHWTVEDLVAMRDHYRAKVRELQKEAA